MDVLGNILIGISLILISIGVYGVLRFKDFYSRILITSKVDTVGLITLMIGVIIRAGFNFFSIKVSLIILLVIITNPLSTHAISRSAYVSGYKIKKEH